MADTCLLLVDKPPGCTSHDVVARARRARGTRKIGHAGTLDPMATGLLILGVEGATRLLTYIVGLDKTYEATIRLGIGTDSDDADGTAISHAEQAQVDSLTDDAVDAAVAALTGRLSQVPSRVSAIKVAGRRAHELAREGVDVELKAREVDVSRFDIRARRLGGGVLDLEVVVDCSSGTYIRALARDLGGALGVGGHVASLRRTRIGPFAVSDAATLDDLESAPGLTPAAVATAVLGRLDVTADDARDLRHGKRLRGQRDRLAGALAAAIDPEGTLVGIVEARGDDLKSAMNMPEPAENA